MALSFEDFKKNLKDGKYESLAGARRAVGKAGAFSDDEREAAKKAIDKHFGAAPQAEKPAKKTVTKKAATKKAAVKAEPKEEKKAAKKGPSKRQPRTTSPVETLSAELLSAGPVNLDDLSSISARMHIADKAIERVTMALNSCSSIGVDKDSAEMKEHRSALSSAISLLKTVTEQANAVSTGKRQPKVVVEEDEETEESNGISKSSLFAGSRPDASADA